MTYVDEINANFKSYIIVNLNQLLVKNTSVHLT